MVTVITNNQLFYNKIRVKCIHFFLITQVLDVKTSFFKSLKTTTNLEL